MVDEALKALDGRFDEIHGEDGRKSTPPERLLRTLRLQMLYTVRRERMLMEQNEYNLPFAGLSGCRQTRRPGIRPYSPRTATDCWKAQWPKSSSPDRRPGAVEALAERRALHRGRRAGGRLGRAEELSGDEGNGSREPTDPRVPNRNIPSRSTMSRRDGPRWSDVTGRLPSGLASCIVRSMPRYASLLHSRSFNAFHLI